MKKILLINNHDLLLQHTLDFATRIAVDEKATLFGLFVGNLKNDDDENNVLSSATGLNNDDYSEGKNLNEKPEHEKTNPERFADRCSSLKVPYKIHTIHNNFLRALVDQSAFADVIICDAESAPSQYSIKTLIASAHCPVLLVNKDYKQTDHIIFAYDDNISSSIHAVKIFTYLFPSLHYLPAHFVSVVPENVIGIQYEDLIREWLSLYFSSAEILIVKGDSKEELSNIINAYSNPVVIMGSFGRSLLSRFFKESLAQPILENTNAPIFIAHD